MMKKLFVCLVLLAAVMAGCHRSNRPTFATTHVEKGCVVCIGATAEGDSLYMQANYSIDWPVKGCLTGEAQRELLDMCFGRSELATIEEAASRWIADLQKGVDVEYASAEWQPTYSFSVSATCDTGRGIALFNIATEENAAMAAHGTYSARTLNVDLATGSVIHLCDLVDTTLFAAVLPQAVGELDTNRWMADCLFDEFRDSLPLPSTFFFDSLRTHLVAVYQLYEVAPYSCGIQAVVLPVEWLNARVPLTPYARRLLAVE